MVILYPLKGEKEVEQVAKKILEACSQKVEINSHSIGVTASIGIANNSPANISSKAIFRRADRAMYIVKDQGGNNFHYYTEA